MKMVSEQQTFSRLRIAPADFAELLLTDENKAMEYIVQLQGEREKTSTKAKKEKDPNAPKKQRGRPGSGLDLTKLG